jgi:hypothetical protein
VIKLLVVHVECVGVTLYWVTVNYNVEITHANGVVWVERNGGRQEFVKVARNHDVGSWVGVENGFDESLPRG